MRLLVFAPAREAYHAFASVAIPKPRECAGSLANRRSHTAACTQRGQRGLDGCACRAWVKVLLVPPYMVETPIGTV